MAKKMSQIRHKVTPSDLIMINTNTIMAKPERTGKINVRAQPLSSKVGTEVNMNRGKVEAIKLRANVQGVNSLKSRAKELKKLQLPEELILGNNIFSKPILINIVNKTVDPPALSNKPEIMETNNSRKASDDAPPSIEPEKKRDECDIVMIGSQHSSLTMLPPRSPRIPMKRKFRKNAKAKFSPYEIKRSPFSEIMDGSISEYLGNQSFVSNRNKTSNRCTNIYRRK